ncbi:MAG: hypothetical protein HC893_13950 [Chloroflexaceae bacterium]|nr:hypothetical protein [Chloroflexaceae bacterium]
MLWQILERRGEIGHPASLGARVAERTHGIRHLFYGRPELKTLTDVIHIGAINVPDTTLAIGVGWYMHRAPKRVIGTWFC